MRLALIAVLAAGLMLGALLVSASGAERPALARAQAMAAAGDIGPQLEVGARGAGDEEARSGGIAVRGLTIGTAETEARTSIRSGNASARAVAAARSVNVFDGLVTAWGVRREAGAGGTVGRVSGLEIDGRMIGEVTGAQTFELPDGGGSVFVNQDGIGLRVVLAKPARGFDAGSEIRVAVAAATSRDAKAAPTATPAPTATAAPDAEEKKAKEKRKRKKKEKARKITAEELARLTAAGFAFPVGGTPETADDFGGPRQIGPHQGNDIFAEFGAPVVAVTEGTISKVGTLPISGNRLWLTSASGDAFFYAHMSSFAPAAVDGKQVKAGTVLGYVGNTGDAEPTPPHLHFEIHPGGEATEAVDPHAILLAWGGRGGAATGADPTERPGALVAVRDFIAE